MDLLRGAAVLLIVVYHSTTVPQLYELVDLPAPVRHFNELLSPYRIPLLLVLSGLLLRRSLAKGSSRFIGGKISHILWPYVLWCLLILLVTADWQQVGSVWFWLGGNMLWYLPVLLFCYAAALANVVRAPWWLAPPAMLAVLWIADPSTNVYIRFLWFGAFFFAGAALYRWKGRMVILPDWAVLLLAAASAAVPALSLAEGKAEHGPWAFIGSLTGAVVLIWLGARVPRGRFSEVLEWYGRNSIVVYVGHALCMFAMVHWLPGAWFGHLTLGALLLGLVSLAVCTALILLRPWSPWLYSLPPLQSAGGG